MDTRIKLKEVRQFIKILRMDYKTSGEDDWDEYDERPCDRYVRECLEMGQQP